MKEEIRISPNVIRRRMVRSSGEALKLPLLTKEDPVEPKAKKEGSEETLETRSIQQIDHAQRRDNSNEN